MSKSPRQRLQPIQHIADGRVDQSARRLADSQRRAAEAEAKLRELRGYLHDYQAGVGNLLDVRLLENRRAFVARLREAETFQTAAVERAHQATSAERDRWLHHRREQQVLEKLAELYRNRENQAEARQAQKTMDEHALKSRHARSHDEY